MLVPPLPESLAPVSRPPAQRDHWVRRSWGGSEVQAATRGLETPVRIRPPQRRILSPSRALLDPPPTGGCGLRCLALGVEVAGAASCVDVRNIATH